MSTRTPRPVRCGSGWPRRRSPTYRIEERIGKIELRRYEPYVVAETLVEGSLERAGNGGVRRLAGYIFGGNETASGDGLPGSRTEELLLHWSLSGVRDRY